MSEMHFTYKSLILHHNTVLFCFHHNDLTSKMLISEGKVALNWLTVGFDFGDV